VNDARTRGISWVIAGMHKQYIPVGAKTDCTMEQALFHKLVELKVDLVPRNHDHAYERSWQPAIGSECATVPAVEPSTWTASSWAAGWVDPREARGAWSSSQGWAERTSM